MAYLLTQLLAESAARRPGSVAIVCGDDRVTYAELDESTSRLAHLLISLGAKRGDRIGIHLGKGIDAITAALAVLKVGAAYVPIDPAAPARRVQYILARCEIVLLLTSRARLGTLSRALADASVTAAVVVVDGSAPAEAAPGGIRVVAAREHWQSLSATAPPSAASDSDLAYVLFTSGSTGNPKGVMLSHRQSLTFVDAAASFFGIVPEDRLSNVSPLHFDMSVFDIFVALKCGAGIAVIPDTSVMFPHKVAETIVAAGMTVWNSVPSLLSMVAGIQHLDAYDFSALRLILFAGERFPLKYLRRLSEYTPNARYCNMYGQTEANSSTYYWVEGPVTDAAATLPIGKPLPNFDVFALDEAGRRVVEPGEEGEFYVRSSSVAYGYYGEPERTERAFVTNPLMPWSRERVYRTGDLVRLDAAGNYVFVGRRDHMIKSRGYRVEIGEIEAVLLSHPDVADAVVIPIPDELLGNRIAAVVAPPAGATPSAQDLRQFCAESLPRYMIPETVEVRPSLPKLSSGKVDRSAVGASLTS